VKHASNSNTAYANQQLCRPSDLYPFCWNTDLSEASGRLGQTAIHKVFNYSSPDTGGRNINMNFTTSQNPEVWLRHASVVEEAPLPAHHILRPTVTLKYDLQNLTGSSVDVIGYSP